VVIYFHSQKSEYVDEHGFFIITVRDLCVSNSPTTHCLKESNLKSSLTVESYGVRESCCSELQAPTRNWKWYKLCARIMNEETNHRFIHDENDKVNYQCVEKGELPIELYYQEVRDYNVH